MTIESTKQQNTDNPAITYSECYQQCFCSDNLELMKTIESNTIDLIYCDILYGTGRKFADYQDLKPIRSEIENHYIPRIKEMHRILKPTGSIYLQMDETISHWLKCILESLFNVRREIIWDIQVLSGFKTMANNWIRGNERILYATKTKKYTFNKQKQPHRKEYLERFDKTDKNGRKFFDGRGKKRYLDEVILKGKAVGDVWYDIMSFQQICTSKERLDYATQKPKALIERIIKASSNEGDLVADFYMGSGTTAEVCKDLDRNFIGCDINPRAVEITLQRLNNARS